MSRLRSLLAATIVVLAVSTAHAQAPAAPGVCYATLGNIASSPGALITVNLTTGAGTLVGPTGISGPTGTMGVAALAIKSSGEIFAMDIGSGSRIWRVDATTGAATMGATTSLSSPTAIAFDGDDQLWAVDIGGDLYRVDEVTGATMLVGATGQSIKGLAFDPTDGTLWGTNSGSQVYTIDVYSGTPTLVGATGVAASPDIEFDASGNLFASSGGGGVTSDLISIDKTTGVGSVVGSIAFASVAGMAARLDRAVATAVAARVPAATLQQNVPNPFNPSTQIDYTLSDDARVRLDIYNVAGRRVRTLAQGPAQAGPHTARWDGRDDHGAALPSGVYFYCLSTPRGTKTRTMVLVR